MPSNEQPQMNRMEEWLESIVSLPGWEGNSIGYDTAIQQLVEQEDGLSKQEAEQRICELWRFDYWHIVPLPDGKRIVTRDRMDEWLLRRERKLVETNPSVSRTRPSWNRDELTLTWKRERVKPFNKNKLALNHIAILNAAEKAGWDDLIPNPFPDEGPAGINRELRMRDAIYGLNRRQTLLRFHFRDGGKKFGWSAK